MKKNNDYFSKVVALYEAAGMDGSVDEVVPQEQIADDGSDVNPGMSPDTQDDVSGEEDMNGEDPNMMMQEPAQPDASAIMEKQKFVKLFGLFEDLLNYGTSFLDALKMLDSNLLDGETTEKAKKYTDNIKKLTDKVNEYIKSVLSSEEYTKALYVYVLFRTELVSNIKGFRDICKLTGKDDKEKK